MGRYLNPKDMTKEEWLEKNAIRLDFIPENHATETHTVAVHVDNGWMTACALAYNQGELQAFKIPEDRRPKVFYLVPNKLTEEFK